MSGSHGRRLSAAAHESIYAARGGKACQSCYFVKSGDGSFGPRISAPRPLKDGDELAFGNARFIFKST